MWDIAKAVLREKFIVLNAFIRKRGRVMSAKQQFSTILLTKKTDFGNHPQMRVPLWKFWNPEEKFQHINRAKSHRLNTLKRITRTVSLYPCHPLSQDSTV